MIIKFTLLTCVYLISVIAVAQELNGFSSLINLTPLPVTKDTGEKPQSKVWTYACNQWAILPNSEGTHLWRLDGTEWTKVLTISEINYKADCKVINNIAHILLFRGKDLSYLVSLEYVPSMNSYKLWSQRTAPVGIALDKAAATATIDIDSKGRMWLASNTSNSITVRWSDSPYSIWSEPITLANGVSTEEICAVIAMPGKTGVLWSNMNKQRFGFKTHIDGAAPGSWSDDEVPASQSALDINLGMADDHLNMAIASDGTLYCAVKTEYDRWGYPKIALLVRRPEGTWDDLYEVSQSGTRPIVILNEEVGKLKVLYTASQASGGNIIYKESATSKILFSSEKTLIEGSYNNATSSKDNYSSEVVVLASNDTHAVGVLASDGIPPEVCPVYADAWLAYPNPFSHISTVYFTSSEAGEYSVSLFDSKGSVITILKQGNISAGERTMINIDGSDLPKGLYLVRLQTMGKTKTLKLILEK